MKVTKWFFGLMVVGALAAAATLGVMAYQSASAAALQQDETPQPEAGVEAQKDLDLRSLRGRQGVGLGVSHEYLAEALGITADELDAAYETATQAALAQAVEDGLITQSQADELLARGAAFPFGSRWGAFLNQGGIDFEALLADALGVSTEELQAAYVEAFNLRVDAAVQEGRITEEQAGLMKGQHALQANANFQSTMQSAFEAAVQAAVDEGVLTQAQADLILEQAQGMPWMGGGHGFGKDHRHGGGLPGLPALPPANNSAPETTPSGG